MGGEFLNSENSVRNCSQGLGNAHENADLSPAHPHEKPQFHCASSKNIKGKLVSCSVSCCQRKYVGGGGWDGRHRTGRVDYRTSSGSAETHSRFVATARVPSGETITMKNSYRG